jgi:integrase/recombinase XerD
MQKIHSQQLEITEVMKSKPIPSTALGIKKHNERCPEPQRVAYILTQVSEPHPTLEAAAQSFLRNLEGLNRSAATISAYRQDLEGFITWLHDNNAACYYPTQVQRIDIQEYLTALARAGLSGVTRARKLAAIREYFKYLEAQELVEKNPTLAIETPKKERKGKIYLRTDEYNSLLMQAMSNPRDYCLLQMFLQTGMRVSELCDLRLSDVDLISRMVTVRGKGQVVRTIELEAKAVKALKTYLAVRPESGADHLFLSESTNPQKAGNPLSVRMVQHLVAHYRKQAGILKKVTPHGLRHTFATYKAEKGVSPYQLQEWLGHANLNTTQIYVHIGRQNARKEMERTSL